MSDETYQGITIAERQWRRYARARDAGHTDFVKSATKFRDYYAGNQWEESVLKKLQEEGRPALTINLILATINTMLGEYARNQADLSYKPKHQGTFEVSQVLTKLAMHVLEESDFQSREWDLMLDGLIPGRAYFDVRMLFDEHMQGDATIRTIDPTEIVLDPDAKEYDPETWTEVTRTYWQSLHEIEISYGAEKREEVERLVSQNNHYAYDSFEFERTGYGDSNSSRWESDYSDFGDRSIRNVRVISRQHRRMVKAAFFVDPETGDMGEAPMTWGEDKIAAFADSMGLIVYRKMASRVRWTVTVDKVVMSDGWSPYKSFTIVPYFPYFLRGKPFGPVENLISPQDHLNKSTSQELHVINTTANSGWTLEEGTLVNMTEDEFQERGAETGLVLVHARGSNAPQKVTANSVPTGLELMSNKSRQFLREISGLEGVLGIGSPEISGVALDSKAARADVQLKVPFTNLARTRRLLGRKLLELFQQFYTEHRIITITKPMHEQDEEPTEQVEINAPTPEGLIANDITQGKYTVVLGTQPSRDNYDDTQFAEALQLREAGIRIPDHIVVRYSRLADRADISEQLEKLAGMAEPTEEEIELMRQQQQLEIQTAQAELEKLMSEAQEIQSRAALNAAKATQQDGGMESPENQLRLQELESKIQMKREELTTRLQLAQLTHRAGQQKQSLASATQLAQSKHQSDTQLRSALINSQSKTLQGE